jgi:hypothetical protein
MRTGELTMNKRGLPGICYAGNILIAGVLLYGAAIRDPISTGIITLGSVISSGVLVLYFVLAVAIWDLRNIIRLYTYTKGQCNPPYLDLSWYNGGQTILGNSIRSHAAACGLTGTE